MNGRKQRKTGFWIILLVAASCVVTICALINPAPSREFPIDGDRTADLDTERVVDMIAKAEKLTDGSQLYVSDNNFDLLFTPDFKWEHDGTIRFFYTKKQQTYSAQLRMFHEENKYFITAVSKSTEPETRFKLSDYLDALKYMPQEEIRKLSPDADSYSVCVRKDGAPKDYERVLIYNRNGIVPNNGWYIHLEIQPSHKVPEGGYKGFGDETIHIFYSH